MSGTKFAFTPYPPDVPILERVVKEKQFVNVQTLIREIVGNWCADQRRDKRLAMSPGHYTARGVDDGWEAE